MAKFLFAHENHLHCMRIDTFIHSWFTADRCAICMWHFSRRDVWLFYCRHHHLKWENSHLCTCRDWEKLQSEITFVFTAPLCHLLSFPSSSSLPPSLYPLLLPSPPFLPPKPPSLPPSLFPYFLKITIFLFLRRAKEAENYQAQSLEKGKNHYRLVGSTSEICPAHCSLVDWVYGIFTAWHHEWMDLCKYEYTCALCRCMPWNASCV